MKKQLEENYGAADKWWLATYHKDGSLAAFEEVEDGAAQKDGKLRIYVCARTKTEALALAKARRRDWHKRRQLRLSNEGLCVTCGKSHTGTSKYRCETCRRKDNASKKEKQRIEALPEPERSTQLRLFKAAYQLRQKAAFNRGCVREKAMASSAAAADRRWDYPGYVPSHPARAILRQCLRAYDLDPYHFRSWLCAKLGAANAALATAAE